MKIVWPRVGSIAYGNVKKISEWNATVIFSFWKYQSCG